VNTKPVEGVVAAYLAKYMSKGRQQVAEAVKDWGEGLCPRTWWNMTAPARAMVKRAVHHGEEVGKLLESVLEYAFTSDVGRCFDFLRHIEVRMGDALVSVGWRGRFCEGLSREIRGMIESTDIGRFQMTA
jgi:hypothetical protein